VSVFPQREQDRVQKVSIEAGIQIDESGDQSENAGAPNPNPFEPNSKVIEFRAQVVAAEAPSRAKEGTDPTEAGLQMDENEVLLQRALPSSQNLQFTTVYNEM
jgi:hypothetical protein